MKPKTTDENTLRYRRQLAEEFDRLCVQQDPKHAEHVIPPHQERPVSFEWFEAGAHYERSRAERDSNSRGGDTEDGPAAAEQGAHNEVNNPRSQSV